MNTAATRLTGIRVPVVCAPMAGVADAGLAIAVSRAGALGSIGIGSTHTSDWIAEQLARVVAADVPFGVGLMAWALPDNPAMFDQVVAAAPTILSISFGDVAPWVSRARDAGITVAVQAGTRAEAIAAEQAGAHLVVARGAEAGGHGRNGVATLPLLQQVLDVVTVPVLAAGGIATARGLAAVIAAGGAGAWVGTAFAACREATSSPAARRAMAAADATDTTYGRLFDIAQRLAWPTEFGGRALANDFTRRWAGRESELADTDLRAEMAAARADGDVTMAPVYCGQAVGQIAVDVPAAEVVGRFTHAEALLRAAAGS